MTAAHTPGPWRINDSQTAVVSDDGGTMIAEHPSIRWSAIDAASASGGKLVAAMVVESDANARLIAASPDLLSACEAMADFLLDTHSENCIEGTAYCSCHHAILWRQAQSAIRAARGEK